MLSLEIQQIKSQCDAVLGQGWNNPYILFQATMIIDSFQEPVRSTELKALQAFSQFAELTLMNDIGIIEMQQNIINKIHQEFENELIDNQMFINACNEILTQAQRTLNQAQSEVSHYLRSDFTAVYEPRKNPEMRDIAENDAEKLYYGSNANQVEPIFDDFAAQFKSEL